MSSQTSDTVNSNTNQDHVDNLADAPKAQDQAGRLDGKSQKGLSRMLSMVESEVDEVIALDRWHTCFEYVMAIELSRCSQYNHTGTDVCKHCGLHPAHLIAAKLDPSPFPTFHAVAWKRLEQMQQRFSTSQMNQRDYSGNNSLHFAARAWDGDSKVLIRLIELGVDIHAANTSGATFLHVLFRYLPMKRLPSCIPVLRHLSDLGFRFSACDYCGQQPVHVLLDSAHNQGRDSFLYLEEAMIIMRTDWDAVDSYKRLSVRAYFQANPSNTKSKAQAKGLLSKAPVSANLDIDFEKTISEMSDDWAVWLDWLATKDRAVWIDRHGNTALIALLKYWNCQNTEPPPHILLEDIITKTVKLGAEIRMRDRYGDTALAVAAKRGLRPAVKVLVTLGASVHTSNHRDMSILGGARKCMERAKANGNDKLHAMIWSCIVYLTDLKACEYPTRRRQHWAAWAPDSHFTWDEGERGLKAEKIVRVLRSSGFV